MTTPHHTPLTPAVHEIFRRGTGSINQVGFDSTGEVTTLTQVRYDLPDRRAAIRQRFGLQADGDLPEGSGHPASEWTEIVVCDDEICFRSPRDETWRVTHAAWPSASPLKHLYWLLGCHTTAAHHSGTDSYAIDLTADSVLAALDPDDQTGISLSLDEAELDTDTCVHGMVTVSDGVVCTFDFTLPGEDGSQYSLAIDAHGRPVDIDWPVVEAE